MIAWRYLFHGQVKHAVGRGENGWIERTAECGICPELFEDWRGTGTQHEYERLKKLRPCANCIRMGYVYREEDL